MTNGKFEILKKCENHVFVELYLEDKCLKLDSEVFGDEFDSKAHYTVDEKNTKKLLNLLDTGGDDVEKLKNLFGDSISSYDFERICNKNGIRYKSIVI